VQMKSFVVAIFQLGWMQQERPLYCTS